MVRLVKTVQGKGTALTRAWCTLHAPQHTCTAFQSIFRIQRRCAFTVGGASLSCTQHHTIMIIMTLMILLSLLCCGCVISSTVTTTTLMQASMDKDIPGIIIQRQKAATTTTTTRAECFPLIDARVRLYMSNWYHPPCAKNYSNGFIRCSYHDRNNHHQDNNNNNNSTVLQLPVKRKILTTTRGSDANEPRLLVDCLETTSYCDNISLSCNPSNTNSHKASFHLFDVLYLLRSK
jgi:hypothetical protein